MSIKKVANIAGVSIATVSRFFNNPSQVSKRTRVKVENAIKKINYQPNALAQNLRRGKTGLIIVVTPSICSPLYTSLMNQLHESAHRQGFNLLVKEAEFNSLSLGYFQNMIRCKQADGFVLLTGLAQQNHIELDVNLPLVLISEPHQIQASNQQLPYLSIDHTGAAREATEYLIDLGHQTIAFIAPTYNSFAVSLQIDGYKKAMSRADLPVFDNLAISLIDENLTIEEKLKHSLTSPSKPTAILCSDDETAIEVLHFAKKHGLKVPNDISIMGFNNTHIAEISDPPLTSIDQPMSTIGDDAVRLLTKLINKEEFKLSEQNTFHHKIIIRQSTTPPIL
jgi:LacI family repressor for deo operon, udp, cdd, tsx, nupC, and nupG